MIRNCNVSVSTPKLAARYSSIILAIVLPLLALHFYAPTRRGLWVETAFEFMHVPVFGIVAISLFALLGTRLPLRTKVAIVAGILVVLGLFSEAAQIPTARDASLGDVFRDMAGGIAGLLGCVAFSRELHRGQTFRISLLAATLLVLLPVIVPLASVSLAYMERNRQLPVLFSSNQRHAVKFVRRNDAETTNIVDGVLGRSCLLANARTDRGPGLAFQDLSPNWGAHSLLTISLENTNSAALEIIVRVHDTNHRNGSQPHDDRYNGTFSLTEGPNTLTIALADIASAPSGRALNLRSIDGIGIFSNDKRRDAGFCVYEIRLHGSMHVS